MLSESKRIMFVQFTDPARLPPLHHSSQILAKDGWNVIVLGVNSPGEESFPSHENIEVSKISRVSGKSLDKLVYLFYAFWTVYKYATCRPSYVYGSDPIVCPIILILESVFQSEVIYHEHDSPTDVSEASRLMQLVYWARRKISKRARACILPHRKRGQHFSKELGVDEDNVYTVWNCPEREDVITSNNKNKFESKNSISIVYIGTIGPDRIPLTVLKAIDNLISEEFCVEFNIIGFEVYNSGYISKMKNESERLGIEGRFNHLGSMNRREAIQFASGCDIGVSFSVDNNDKNFKWMATASNKTFDYMAAGLAVLVSDIEEWNNIFVDRGFGESCDHTSAESIANSIRKLASDRGRLWRIKNRSKQKILNDWNYERKFSPVKKLIDDRV